MGSFSNNVFSILLGWLQILVSMIWSALTATDGHSFLQLIGENWILIAAVLCIIGLAADFAVYLFRWQPYKVWKTFLNHIRNGKKAKQSMDEKAEDAGEDSFQFGYRPVNRENQKEEEPDLEPWRDPEAETEGSASPVITKSGYSVPEDSPYRRPANRRRNRLRIDHLLGEETEDDSFHYSPPKPMIDQNDAYQPPVYPEKWTGSRNQNT